MASSSVVGRAFVRCRRAVRRTRCRGGHAARRRRCRRRSALRRWRLRRPRGQRPRRCPLRRQAARRRRRSTGRARRGGRVGPEDVGFRGAGRDVDVGLAQGVFEHGHAGPARVMIRNGRGVPLAWRLTVGLYADRAGDDAAELLAKGRDVIDAVEQRNDGAGVAVTRLSALASCGALTATRRTSAGSSRVVRTSTFVVRSPNRGW